MVCREFISDGCFPGLQRVFWRVFLISQVGGGRLYRRAAEAKIKSLSGTFNFPTDPFFPLYNYFQQYFPFTLNRSHSGTFLLVEIKFCQAVLLSDDPLSLMTPTGKNGITVFQRYGLQPLQLHFFNNKSEHSSDID